MRLMMNRLKRVSSETTKVLKDMNVDKLFQKHEQVKIAITGLSRSGKTVFITSLVNQLLSGKRIQRVMRERDKEFICRIVPNESGETAVFDYRTILDGGKSETPKWPQSTSNLSKITIQIEVKSKSSFFPNKFIDLQLIDYPGEWLFDLEMANMSFLQWSEVLIPHIKTSSKKDYAREWLEELSKHDIYGFSDGSADQEIVDKYKSYLKKLQDLGYSVIQPGRNFYSGTVKDQSILIFTPLPKPKYIQPHEDSIYSRFEKRYDRYLSEIVLPVAEEYFSQFDRQIVLVDLLKTLQNGYYPFIDMSDAIKKIVAIYKYGNQSFLKSLMERKIDRVLFGATKADYIPTTQHGNFQKLLDSLVEEAKKELSIAGIDAQSVIFSSIRSTEDAEKRVGDRSMSCVKGKLAGSQTESIEYVGDIPEDFPSKNEWREEMFNFPKFSPVQFPDRDIDAVPHINMDLIIDYLIGDKL
jgi:predicted YcjX-like family ATPase